MNLKLNKNYFFYTTVNFKQGHFDNFIQKTYRRSGNDGIQKALEVAHIRM